MINTTKLIKGISTKLEVNITQIRKNVILLNVHFQFPERRNETTPQNRLKTESTFMLLFSLRIDPDLISDGKTE